MEAIPFWYGGIIYYLHSLGAVGDCKQVLKILRMQHPEHTLIKVKH